MDGGLSREMDGWISREKVVKKGDGWIIRRWVDNKEMGG